MKTFLVSLALAAAAVAAAAADRATIEPLAGVQVSYEPGRFDGSFATPVGTLRTSVRATPGGVRQFEHGDISFELAAPIVGGHLQLRELEGGGSALSWRAPAHAGLHAETHWEWTPVRSAQALHLRQQFGDGQSAQALVSASRTPHVHGSRWDLEFTQATRRVRWSAGIDAADRDYVSAWGACEPRVGVRVAAQWQLLPGAWVEARYSRHARWDTERPVSWGRVGTRFELPYRASLATSLETDAEQRPKASLTLSVPLARR